MVRSYVRDDGDVRPELIAVVQLETADFQYVVVEMLGGNLIGVALAYVSAETYVESGLLEQVVDQRGCRGLAVASGYAYFLRGVVSACEFYF